MNGRRRLADVGAGTAGRVWRARRERCFPDAMAIHPGVEVSVERLEVLESVRPRLADIASGPEVEALIGEAFDDLTPASITTYLPILVERRVRDRVRHHPELVRRPTA